MDTKIHVVVTLQAFCLLPLAFVINSSIFVVHGGLSRSESTTLSDIEKIDRKKEPGDDSEFNVSCVA